MEHKEYVRIVPEARTAVLFMHGIVGTPVHFQALLPLVDLVPEDWSVYNLLLPGHGSTVKAFGKSSMKEWKEYAWNVFGQLAQTHERIVLVGHSMGTLFSIQLALEYPEKVSQLFLIAVPLRVGVKFFGAVNMLRMTFGVLDQNDPLQAATQTVCGTKPTWMVWKYIPWLPRLWELIGEMHSTAKVVGDLRVPCIAYQSRRDELVSKRSGKILGKCGRVEVHNLLGSTHFYYSPEDIDTVCKRFDDIIKTAGS
jgi:esterase/lipase